MPGKQQTVGSRDETVPPAGSLGGGPQEAAERDRPRLRRRPKRFVRLDLTAAGKTIINARGNSFVLLRLDGTTPEICIRYDREDAEGIYLRSPVALAFVFRRLYVSWVAVVNGEADILVGTIPT